VPVEILAGRQLCVIGEEQALQKRWPSVILLHQGVSADGVGQGFGNVDLQRWTDGEQARVEGDVVSGTGGQAVSGTRRSLGKRLSQSPAAMNYALIEPYSSKRYFSIAAINCNGEASVARG
jgi:hypothetical protein